MNKNQEKLLRVMQQLSSKAPQLYKAGFGGWGIVFGFGSSKGACTANYICDQDVEELQSNGFIDNNRLTDYGKQIR